MISLDGTIGHGVALRAVSLDLGDEVLGVTGPNGSGKTTLLRTLAGLLTLVSGSLAIDGVVVDDAHRFVHPEDRLVRYASRDVSARGSVLDALGFPMRCRGASRRAARQAADRAVGAFGLDDLASLSMAELSQGQRARVGLAQACVGDSRAILLDEPFGGLDVDHRRSTLEILAREVRRSARCAVVVSHNAEDLAALCDRIVSLDELAVA